MKRNAIVFFLEGIFFGGFFGQVWRNLGKNPSRPQKFACSCIYEGEVAGLCARPNYNHTTVYVITNCRCWRPTRTQVSEDTKVCAGHQTHRQDSGASVDRCKDHLNHAAGGLHMRMRSHELFSGSQTFSDRVSFVGHVLSTRTALPQEKSMCQI